MQTRVDPTSTGGMLEMIERDLIERRATVRMPAGWDPLMEMRLPSATLAVLRALAEMTMVSADAHRPQVDMEVQHQTLAPRCRLPVHVVHRALEGLRNRGFLTQLRPMASAWALTLNLSGFEPRRYARYGCRFPGYKWPPGYYGEADLTWLAEAAIHGGGLWPVTIRLNRLSPDEVRVYRGIGDGADWRVDRPVTIDRDDLAEQCGQEAPPMPGPGRVLQMLRMGTEGRLCPLGFPLFLEHTELSETRHRVVLNPMVWFEPMHIRSVAWNGAKLGDTE